MKCTGKEQSSCNVEKMGCRGCAFDDTEARVEEVKEQIKEAKKRKWNDITVPIDILELFIK